MQSTTTTTMLFALCCFLLATAVLAAPAPSPFQSQVHDPPRQARDNSRHGEVSGGVRHDKGVGTTVYGRGSGDAWVSRDGNTRVNVGGHYGQVVGGPARGQKDYGAHVGVVHKF